MTNVSVPTGINSGAKLGDAIAGGVVNIGVQAGEALLFADLPWLAFPGLKQIVQLLIGWLASYVIRGLSQVVVFTIIDLQVHKEETDFNQALANLKAAQAKGNPDEIQKALSAFQVAAQNLGHSDGSAPPR